MINLLNNGRMEQSSDNRTVIRYSETAPEGEPITRREVVNPADWQVWEWWSDQEPPWDPGSGAGFASPETAVIFSSDPRFLDPPRIFEGTGAQQMFTFYKRHNAGSRQQVVGLSPGSVLRAEAVAHAWSLEDTDNPRESQGVGESAFRELLADLDPDDPQYDAKSNFQFRIGIDPTGGDNPRADTVVWGQWVCIYNSYADVPAVEVEAVGTIVTFFTEEMTRWCYKHNDGYWDSLRLSVVSVPEPPEPPSGVVYTEYGSKRGVHTIYPSTVPAHAAYMEEMLAPLPVVKCVADWSTMKLIKNVSPDTLIIGRFVTPFDGAGDLEGEKTDTEIEAMADYIMRGYYSLLQEQQHLGGEDDRLPYVWLFELLNEVDAPGVEGYRNLARLMIAMLDIGENWDLPIHNFACLGLNNGTPEWAEMVAMAETGLLERIAAGGHALSLHEGAHPFSDPIDKWWGPGHTIPGAPEVEGAGALTFRYRYWLHLARQRGVYLPIVISEFYSGPGYAPCDEAQIIERTAWYDGEASRDPELICFCPFTNGPTEDWSGQNYDPFLPAWAQYDISVRDRQNAIPETPQPPDGICYPRVPYDNVTILLPPTAGGDWIISLAPLYDRHHFTITGSADDAGHRPNCGTVTVLAANPQDWPGDLAKFFADHYPYVTMVSLCADGPEALARAIQLWYEPEPPPPAYEMWRQGDPRWGGKELDNSGKTMAQIGCATTAVAKFMAQADPTIDPGTLCDRLNTVYGYLFDGRLVWTRVPEVIEGVEFRRYFIWRYTGQVADMDAVRMVMARGKGAIIEVDFKPETPEADQHFVYLFELLDDDTDALVGDPWTGEIGRLSEMYWEGSLPASINALVDFEIIEEPPDPQFPPNPIGSVVGVHAAPSTEPPVSASVMVERLQDLDVKWYMMLDAGSPQNDALAAALRDSGITTVLRMYQQGQFPGRLAPPLMIRARQLHDDYGVKYIRLGNEPNLDLEWATGTYPANGWRDTTLVNQVAENWYRDAADVITWGGIPGLYAMAPTDNMGGVNSLYSSVMWAKSYLDYLYAYHRHSLSEWLAAGRIFLDVHAVVMNRPFSFDPLQFGPVDDMCLRGHEWLQDYVLSLFGSYPLTISTEGGVFSPEHMQQLGWDPGYTDSEWGTHVWDMYEWLAGYDRLATVCSWNLTDEGVSEEWHGCGWYGPLGESRTPVTVRTQ